MIAELRLYYRTIKYLKPVQIRYRLWYMLRNKLRKITGPSYSLSISRKAYPLDMIEGIPSSVVYRPSLTKFAFLNQPHTFKESIDWNFGKYGKLWTYNLNYFDFLNQEEVSPEEGLGLIRKFIKDVDNDSVALDPHPISLRGMNWITFLSRHNIRDRYIEASLYAQYRILLDNMEYHIHGNHLLENGCSLLFGAFFFRDEMLWNNARKLMNEQLKEQVLDDGGHFERSAMYHCIVSARLLDCYNVLEHNRRFDQQKQLQSRLSETISRMLGWLDEMQWQKGDLPEVNDHITEMTPDPSVLFGYADRLGISADETFLGHSGYRKAKGRNYEVLMDVGNIGPDHIPGHAHSDIFSFLLRIKGREVITDTATSTYENNERRNNERSTAAHNTVAADGREQNEVWSAFRVGRRAHVTILKDEEQEVKARHDGYGFMDIVHERYFRLEDDAIQIFDHLQGGSGGVKGICYLNFAPGIEVTLNENELKGENFRIVLKDYFNIEKKIYHKAVGYNKLEKGTRIAVSFYNKCETEIMIS